VTPGCRCAGVVVGRRRTGVRRLGGSRGRCKHLFDRGVDVERVFVVCWASSERMFDEHPF